MLRTFSAAAAARALLCAITLVLPTLAHAMPVPQPRPVQYRSYQKEIDCLAKAIYFEARGEPVRGQQLVAQVILNRMESPYYPDTACDVVYQNDHLRNACQFSFACDGVPDRITERSAFWLAKRVAVSSFGCDASCRYRQSFLSWSTHYHADYVSPGWSRKLKRTGKVGSHIFYFTASM